METKKNVYEMVTERVMEQMKQGIIPWHRPWTGAADGAINYVTRKPYSLDCQPETRRRLLLTKSTEWQRDCIMKLAETFKDLCNYLVTEHCVSDEQRTEFFEMIDRNVERAKLNWAPHEMVPQVDFFCEKVTLLADACGVTKHKEEEDSE